MPPRTFPPVRFIRTIPRLPAESHSAWAACICYVLEIANTRVCYCVAAQPTNGGSLADLEFRKRRGETVCPVSAKLGTHEQSSSQLPSFCHFSSESCFAYFHQKNEKVCDRIFKYVSILSPKCRNELQNRLRGRD